MNLEKCGSCSFFCLRKHFPWQPHTEVSLQFAACLCIIHMFLYVCVFMRWMDTVFNFQSQEGRLNGVKLTGASDRGDDRGRNGERAECRLALPSHRQTDGAVCCVKPQDTESHYEPLTTLPSLPSSTASHQIFTFTEPFSLFLCHLPPVTFRFIFHSLKWLRADSVSLGKWSEANLTTSKTEGIAMIKTSAAAWAPTANIRSPRKQVNSGWRFSLFLYINSAAKVVSLLALNWN